MRAYYAVRRHGGTSLGSVVPWAVSVLAALQSLQRLRGGRVETDGVEGSVEVTGSELC